MGSQEEGSHVLKATSQRPGLIHGDPTRRFDRTASAAELATKYESLAPGEEVQLEGTQPVHMRCMCRKDARLTDRSTSTEHAPYIPSCVRGGLFPDELRLPVHHKCTIAAGGDMEAVRGRVIARRAFGKLAFYSLQDESGTVQ
eukprot:7727196-Pyramimonas_sp.AAC.1